MGGLPFTGAKVTVFSDIRSIFAKILLYEGIIMVNYSHRDRGCVKYACVVCLCANFVCGCV